MDIKGFISTMVDRQRLADSLHIFERQVQAFPLFVVILSSLSFFWGGQCALWTWWVGSALVVAIPFFRNTKRREALLATLLFAEMLFVVRGGLPPVLWDNASFPDLRFYHLPMVQLLAEGWNPIVDPQGAGILSNLGLAPWGMAPAQVAFSNKPLAVFAAVAYKFVGDPTGLTVPGLAFLWLGLALQAARLYRGVARWVVLATLIWVLPMVPGHVFVDVSLAIAACGLLFAQADALRGKQIDWFSLCVWTTWLMSIKLNGCLAAFVFWGLFAIEKTWQGREEWKKWIGRFALFGAGVTLVFGILAWNPLMTTWKTFGHPLYPFKAVPGTLGPRPDPTWDLRVVNDDYRAMGKLGIWVREYISPRLTAGYYRMKLGREDFAPEKPWHPLETGVKFRLAFWATMLVLALHPRGRAIGVGGLLLTLAVPWDVIGYLRYEPWYSSMGCVAIALLAERAFRNVGAAWERCWGIVTACVFLFVAGYWTFTHARNVEFKAVELDLERERVRCRFFKNGREPSAGVDPSDFGVLYNYLTAQENHCRLLTKALGHEGKTRILGVEGWRPTEEWKSLSRRPLWKWDQRQWFIPEDERDFRCLEDLGTPWQEGNVWEGFCDPAEAEPWIMTPMNLYWVPLGDHTEHFIEYFTLAEPREGETRMGRAWRRAKYALKAWGMTYPKEVWRWMRGRQRHRNQ